MGIPLPHSPPPAPHPASPPLKKHHLGDPLDLADDWYGGTALVVLPKADVPQVQDAGNDSKEVLGTREEEERYMSSEEVPRENHPHSSPELTGQNPSPPQTRASEPLQVLGVGGGVGKSHPPTSILRGGWGRCPTQSPAQDTGIFTSPPTPSKPFNIQMPRSPIYRYVGIIFWS